MPHSFRLDGPLDAEAGLFFEDELRTIDERILEDERAPLSGFSVIPQNGESVEPFAKQYEQRSMQLVGVAEFLGDGAQDMPFVDASLRADVLNVRTFGCAFAHNFLEIEAARAKGRPIEAWRAKAARVANEEKHNRIMWYGDPAAQLFGVLNNPYFSRYFFADPIDNTTAATTILNQVNELLTVPFDETETNAQVDFLGLPPQQFRHIMTTPLQTGSDTTIAEHLVKSNPRLTMDRIMPIRELRASGSNGEDLVVAWETDPDVLSHNVAITFRRFAPQAVMLEMIVPTIARSGGISTRRPRHAVIGVLP